MGDFEFIHIPSKSKRNQSHNEIFEFQINLGGFFTETENYINKRDFSFFYNSLDKLHDYLKTIKIIACYPYCFEYVSGKEEKCVKLTPCSTDVNNILQHTEKLLINLLMNIKIYKIDKY
jgi:hypothetical protein